MEEQEEKSSLGWIATLVQLLVLAWSLGVISMSYFGNPVRQIDTTFAAGLLSGVLSNFGLNIKGKNGNSKKDKFVVDNKDNKSGIK
tara:strand:- start:362 stop:619 length:258 start_codon:yes stop_codon:yes gene_type:complete